MKKKLALLTLLAGTLLTTPVMANSYINDDVVNVRAGIGTDAPIMAQLPYGTPVDVIEWDCCGWACVSTPACVGYVMNALVRNEGRAAEMQAIANNYSSGTGRLIVVDTQGYPMTYVMTGSSYNWQVEAVFDCAVGAPETPTPTGVFSIQNHRNVMLSECSDEWFVSDFAYDENWQSWSFHSTLCVKGTTEVFDDRVGGHISNGCVRLHIQDAQWIFENCGCGTTVVIL